MPWWGKADDFALANLTLARIHLAQSNKRDAMEAVEKATQFTTTRGVFSEARRAVEVARVRMWLAQGELEAAQRWAASHEEPYASADQLGFSNELTHMTRARVLIAQHRLHEAIGLLSHLEEGARLAGRMGRVIEILLLKALAMREAGDSENSIRALTECLALAEPEGYVRIFLDEGRPMQLMLAQWLAHAAPGSMRDYALRLLSHFGVGPELITAAQEERPQAGSLVEPLSERELEVLHLIALGGTNQEIARQLVVAPGTVKAHTANIYRKLDVTNRTEAVARARQLGILA
jgi:LuxR family maltose regulon positive regulatory protein